MNYLTVFGLLFALLFFFFRPDATDAPASLAAPAHQPKATAEATFESSDEPTDTRTVVRWFLPWDDQRVQEVALPLVTLFEQQNPTIHVVLQNIEKPSDYYRELNIALTQGTGPDLFYPSTLVAYELALQDLLLPLDELIAADELDLTAFDQAVLALYRNPTGRYHCLPLTMTSLAIVYNKDLFDAAGVPYPQAPWDWEDLLTTAQQLTRETKEDGKVDLYGIDRFDRYWPLLVWTATGQNVFDDPYTPTQFLLEEEEAITGLQWLADLSLVQEVMPPAGDPGDEAAPPNRFLAGQVAMQITDLEQSARYRAAPDLSVDFVELPAGDFVANRIDGRCLAIARNTQQVEAVWAFVKFLAAPGGQGATRLAEMQQITPVLRELQSIPSFRQPSTSTVSAHNYAAFLPKTDYRFSLYDPLHPIYRRWEAVTEEELGALWHGEQSAAEAVEAMKEEAEEILDNLQSTTEAATREATTVTSDAIAENATVENSIVENAPFDLPHDYYVAPDGDDDADGESALTAFATLQQALNVVQASDTIHLLPGDYFENVTSVVGGSADAPITIMGPTEAILHGKGDASAVFYLTHSYYTLVGFTIDGLYGDPTQKEGYSQKLLYVQGEGDQAGVTGLRVLNMTLQNAGGECLRLRYFAQNNEIAYSTFLRCGLLDFEFAEGGKNGEAIYIGTSSTQWEDGKNPTADPDHSTQNWVHHNNINTQGNECVEIKEGGDANLIEHNRCTGQLDPNSGGIGVRGDRNIIRYNVIYGNIGAGVRIGGHEVDGVQYGVANEVYGNRIFTNVAGGVNIAIEPQAKICGNHLARNLGKESFGDGSEAYDPTEVCK